jgi:RNA polymerase sigma factor (sigma-70 family)
MDSQEDPKGFLLEDTFGDIEEDGDNSSMEALEEQIRLHRKAWQAHGLAVKRGITVFTPKIGLEAKAVIPVPVTIDEDFEKLMKKHDKELRAYIRWSVHKSREPEKVVDDIMQQTWIKAYEFMKTQRWHPISAAVFSHIPQVPFTREVRPEKIKQANVRAWLFSIARRNIADYIREEKARHQSSDPYDLMDNNRECDEMDQPEVAWIYKEHIAEIDQAIEELPEAISRVFKLLRKGYSNTEIAKELGYPYGTVGSHVLRGRKYLRKALATKKMRKRAKPAS